MKISPISYNKISIYKPSFKNKFSTNETNFESREVDKKREIDAEITLSKADVVIAQARSIQKIAQRKLEEAQKINFYWQEEKPSIIYEKGATKEYLTSWGEGLKLYIEKREDGTERTIKYYQGEVVDITETDEDGKQYIYSFNRNMLTRYIKAKHSETKKNDVATLIPSEFLFNRFGDLHIYREDYRDVKAYNRSQELLGTFITIGTVMDFAMDDKRPYLERSRTGIFISPSGKHFTQKEFEFDKNGELIR